VLRETLPEF